MSNINFQQIVQSVLFEEVYQGANYPKWFVDILNQHKKLGLGEVDNNSLRSIFILAFKPYISGEDARQIGKNILILDVIKSVYEMTEPKPPKNIATFFTNEVNTVGEQMAATVLAYTNKNQWLPQNPQVALAYKQAKPTVLGTISKVAGALGALRTGMGPVG